MKTFYQFLESMQDQVNIDMSKYEKVLQDKLDKTVEYSAQNVIRLKSFKFNLESILKVLRRYPPLDKLVQNRVQENPQKLHRTISYVYNYLMKHEDYKTHFDEFRNVMRALWDYESQVTGSEGFTQKQADDLFLELVQKTKLKMETIALNIKGAIERIGSDIPIIIEAGTPEDIEDIVDSAHIILKCGTMSPSFSYFTSEGKVEIDDVLDSGDSDFFDNNKSQSDYFSLIKELQNPGSSSKPGKMMILYTARPKKDRELYQNTSTVPNNIFLTSRYDSAEGIGRDFGGRDIYKIKIDSRYLMNTLDTPYEKQFQVVGPDKVPVSKIELVSMN